ncbi:MAG: Uma2 family endonuclease [Pseudomonadota bacterium]|nr:Uma2 family endonuclease [Pseudomonadota bacterium]
MRPGLRRFQLDVLLACGERLDGDDLVVPAPLLIVEVVSPSSEGHDLGLKLDSYFALPSVKHYLVVFADRRLVVQHSRQAGPGLLTTLHHEGSITLDPPGIVLSLGDMYAGSNLDDC